jgi:hypothetical protein
MLIFHPYVPQNSEYEREETYLRIKRDLWLEL